ncbi:MAG TPA: pitrilysin family protein [Thermoanaerobaculia bacterium]|jgi:zinc protease
MTVIEHRTSRARGTGRGAALAAALLAALALPAGAAGPAKSLGEIRYPPLPDFKIPQPERLVLGNGMVVMLLEDHELPLVDAVAFVRTGSRLEPAEKAGLASLTGQMLRSGGTSRMKADQLDDFLDDKGAIVESSIREDTGRVTLSSLKEDLPAVFPVFADVLRHPAFAEDKLAVARNQAIAQVARQNDNPQQVIFREFRKVVYGADSPYARTPSYASLGRIGRADLVAWHAEYFQPDRVVLGVTGDFRRDEMLKLIEAAFGDWPRGSAAKPPQVPYRTTPAPGVYYAEKNDMTQSNVAMGGLGILRSSPDYYPLEVLNYVLSGSDASRLFANVRSKKGLAYAVFGDVGSDWDHPGTLTFFLSTKTESTGAGIEALLTEARETATKPPTDEEVEKAKQALLNSFVFRVDSRREVLERELELEYYGYPLDWLAKYRPGIEAVTTAQVRAAAVKYLHPDQFAIVVVGPSKGTDRPLTDFGKVTSLDISIPRPPGAPRAGKP